MFAGCVSYLNCCETRTLKRNTSNISTVRGLAGCPPHFAEYAEKGRASCTLTKPVALLIGHVRSTSLRLSRASRMDAALKEMCSLRRPPELNRSALKQSSLGHGQVRKTDGAFVNGVLPRRVEPGDEAATELLHLGEGVRLTALIDDA